MLSGMLYCVYIIHCLDQSDVAASVAIVVLIRGRSASANGSSHRVRGYPRPQKNLRITDRKRTGPQSAHHCYRHQVYARRCSISSVCL